MFSEDPNEFEVDISDEQMEDMEQELSEENLGEPTQEDWDSFEDYLSSRQLEEDFFFQQQEDTWG